MNGDSHPLRGAFWNVPLAQLQQALEADCNGLTTPEVHSRFEQWGANTIEGARARNIFIQFLQRFRNPLVLVLLAAAVIAGLTGDRTSCIIIISVMVLGILLDSAQEFRAERAAASLKRSVALREHVLRDSINKEVNAEEIVPGDVVLLAAGDLVPADGRVLAARDFFVNQALLTGESYPVEKRPQDAADKPMAEAENAVFMGTSVISGSATVLICKTGLQTELGRIVRSLQRPAPPAPLERSTFQFGLLILRITGLLVLFVLLVNVLFHRPLLESFLFALALAVGLTPELLPMVVSVTLARGAIRMAAKRVIVKRMAAIHDLGSMDILCTDKTGTLTEARIRLVKYVDADGREEPRVLELAQLNSHFESGIRSPLDDALLAEPLGHVSQWRKIDEVPFDFGRRRVSVLVEKDSERLLVVKGAPEDILALCSQVTSSGADQLIEFDAARRRQAENLFNGLSDEGFRILAVAWRKVDRQHDHAGLADECSLILAGFVAFLDPPKNSASDALATLQKQGVQIKILTGDNERVTQHVCRELRIPVVGLLTGGEIAHLSDEALSHRIAESNLFCRVTPAQKHRIILALKRRGKGVGFLGDGINDAPSLHSADVGISVDSAVDVAKDAADIILLNRDLAVLSDGVAEGRRTFGNIMKYVMMATSSNFGNMFSMAFASLLLPFLPMRPVQILLNNLLYDLSEVPIPLDTVDNEALAAPQHWDMRFIRNFMIALGPVSSLFDFLTFVLLLRVFHASEQSFQTGWFVESLATQVLVIFVIRSRGNPLLHRPHRLLSLTSISVVFLAAALPYTPIGQWFGFVPLPAALLAAIGVMTAAYLLLAQSVKMAFYRRYRPKTAIQII